MEKRIVARSLDAKEATEAIRELETSLCILLRGAMTPARAAEMRAAVLASEEDWTPDFKGEQFALGRAFYTHLETGASRAYFESASRSDALVERVLPGMQNETLNLLAKVTGGHVRRRHGFCGPGVHVFPSGGTVARTGGVVHYDLEGLTDEQVHRRAQAVTLVWMLGPPESGGGLRLFDALYDGRADTEIDLAGLAAIEVSSGAGDALLLDSRRLHQIMPFEGSLHRISITVHAVEVDRGVWEAWF